MTPRDGNPLTTADLASAPARNDPGSLARPNGARADEERVAIFSDDALNHLRPAWTDIQTRFIDEPRKSVEEADALVASTIQRLAESFANERARLESQWARGGDVSTEDLRLALRRYRSFFDRLLNV